MTLNRRHLASIAAFGAAAAVAGHWLTREGPRLPAPELSFTLLDGAKVSTSDFRGQVLLVNFWATSCSTCVTEMPQIADAQRRHGRAGFKTLAVAMRYDPPVRVADFAQHHQLPFGVVIDNTGDIAAGFGNVEVTPTSFLIDKRGHIARRFVGAPDFAALDRLVVSMLEES